MTFKITTSASVITLHNAVFSSSSGKLKAAEQELAEAQGTLFLEGPQRPSELNIILPKRLIKSVLYRNQ